MKESEDIKNGRKDKGLELLADAASAMLYSEEEFGMQLSEDEVSEFRRLRDTALLGKEYGISYEEQDNDTCTMAAEDAGDYE